MNDTTAIQEMDMDQVTHMRPARTRGFSLLELVIVLGVTGLIFGGLWGLLTSSNSQLQAQTVAKQYRQVLEAVRQYALAGGDGNYESTTSNFVTAPTITILKNNNLLSSGFGSTDANGNGINIKVYAVDGSQGKYQILVYSDTAATTVSDKQGAQISALIGAEGGFVYSKTTDGCTTTAAQALTYACGSYNSFTLNLNSKPETAAPSVWLGAGPYTGRIVAYGNTADTVTGSVPYLYRKLASNTELNTMSQEMYFSNTASPLPNLQMQGNNIYMNNNSGTGGGALYTEKGNIFTAGGAVNLAGGTLDLAGVINGATGSNTSINMSSSSMLITNNGSIIVNTSGGMSLSGYGGVTPTVLFSINGTGKADVFQAGSFIYTSDTYFKHDIKPIEDALEKLMQLKGVRYRWNSNDTQDIGVIAQDVQKVFPEVVQKLSDGHMGVDYPKMIAPIIEAIRELREENEKLKGEIATLKAGAAKGENK